jgi:hypothetical protein
VVRSNEISKRERAEHLATLDPFLPHQHSSGVLKHTLRNQ